MTVFSTEAMFINVSNHPSSKWKSEQYQAAEKWGEVIDIPFPAIPSLWDGEQVREIALEYLDRIKQLAPVHVNDTVIHVVGEPVFTYMLVTQLLAEGYEVVASTTDREVVFKGEEKISVFKFVRFRPYLNPCR